LTADIEPVCGVAGLLHARSAVIGGEDDDLGLSTLGNSRFRRSADCRPSQKAPAKPEQGRDHQVNGSHMVLLSSSRDTFNPPAPTSPQWRPAEKIAPGIPAGT